MFAFSRLRNSRVLESRHIEACSDDSGSARVDGVGTSLARAVGRSEGQRPGVAVRACGRPRRAPRGWLSPAPKRCETSDPCCAETPVSLEFRPACDQACASRPRVPATQQRDHGLRRSGLVAVRVRRYRTQAPARQQTKWWRQGPAECVYTPALRYRAATEALPTQLSGPGKSTVPAAGAM